MIKILYFINKIKDAGAQKHLLEVVAGIDKARFEPELVTLEELGIKRIYGISGIRGLLRLVGLIKKGKFDIIHSYLFSENILGSIAARIAGVPVLITSRRDTGMLYQDKPHYIWAYRFTNHLVDKIICVSQAVKKAVITKEKVNIRKIEVIYNGVDVNKYVYKYQPLAIRKSLGIEEDKFVVGIVANFGWIKGHHDFIEAACIVLQEIPNTTFLFVGDGPLKKLYQDLIYNTHYAIRDNFLFLGSRKDIPGILSIVDVSVNASYSEGMSNTILESMALGIPVVATSVDGNLEIVGDGITGLLVPSQNPKLMAEAIIRILKDKELAGQMSKNAKRVIEDRFTAKIMIKNMECLYEQLLKLKIAFIFSQFPCYDETFILREMNQLSMDGLNFDIYSIKKNKDNITHEEAGSLAKNTYYLPLFSLRLFFINIFYLISHPFRYLITFRQVFFGNLKSLNFFVKSLVSWMQAVGFAWKARRDKIRHVHGEWATFPATQAFIISKLNNIPFSFTGHAHDIYRDITMLTKKIKEAKFVTTCTQNNKQYLLDIMGGSFKDKIIVNYHGVDIEKFHKNNTAREDSTKKFKILSVGSLLKCKGFDILIDACKILKEERIDFDCIIAGGGVLENCLRKKARVLGLDNLVKFTGYITQDKLIPLYQQADVFALPMRSRIHWGIPNVLLEAMAGQVPVICTNLASIPELIADKKSGFIVEEENPQALADILINLYQNISLGKQAGNAGFEIIKEKFDIKINSHRLMALFNMSKEDYVPKEQPNLLYVIPSLEVGGAERVVINLARTVDRNRFNPIVCCLNDKGILANELEKTGIRVIALNKKGKFDFSVISKLIRVIKENNIKIIHTHLWGANFWGRIAAKLTKIPVIIATEHNVDIWKPQVYFMLDRWLARKTDKIIVVSNKVKEFYAHKGIPTWKLEVIYNGIQAIHPQPVAYNPQIREEFGIKDNEIVLAIIGRLVPQKGHRYLFEAISSLNGQYRLKVLVVGDGPLMANLKSQVAGLKLQERIIFTGLRKDVLKILEEVDILVMPSLREGLPITALEAMAAGVPIIATKVGGLPELIKDNKTGLLIEPANGVAIKDAIEKLINDKDLSDNLKNNARNTVQKEFNIMGMVNKTQRLYEGLYIKSK